MNKLVIAFLISLLFGNYSATKQQTDILQYIEIKHEGVEEKLTLPLFISNKALRLEVKGDYVIINKFTSKLVSIEDRDILSHGDFITLKVDQQTFKKLYEFIRHYPHYLNGKGDEKSVNYSIFLNDEKHNITYEQTRKFFADINKFLKAGNYEKVDVDKLSSYFQDRFY